MAVQCVLVGKGKDDVFTAVYGETTFDKVLKAYNENKVVQVIYQNRIYYLDNTTVVDSPEAFSFISAFSNQNDETGEIKHYVISLMTGDSWSGPFLQNSTPATHANTHAKDGTDPLAPADIGAMELSENILKQSNEDITSQVAQALSKNLVPFSGGTMTGLLNVLTPVGDSNATTKKYVDDALNEKIGMDGIGDLHVWRKTVVTKDPVPEVPGSYTLGNAAITNLAQMTSNGYNGYAADILVSKEIKVNLDGSVELVSPTSRQMIVAGSSESYMIDVNSDELLGAENRYFTPSEDSESNSQRCTLLIPPGTVYYVAPGTTYATAERSIGFTSAFNAAQLVTGVPGTPAIPAGTATTYPVSTNPNAYQEGSDAKPAGYVLGEATNGVVISDMSGTADFKITTGTTVNVSNDGAVVLGGSVTTLSSSYRLSKIVSDLKTYGSGKFCSIVCTFNEQYTSGKFLTGIWYIPSDATMSVDTTIAGAAVNLSVVGAKPVTGYAAIPAGTTIEYLGKLGDKARMQVVSYVGTGTYGKDNKNQLTFSGKPRFIMVPGDAFGYAYIPKGSFYYIMAGNYATLENLNCVWNDDTNTMTWYHSNYPYRQYNVSGGKYTFVAIY